MMQAPFRSTLDTNHPPHWVKWLNWSGQQLTKIGLEPIQLSEASLLATAQNQTQLSDWGDDSFLIGLQTLINALNQEANLNLVGRLLLRQYLTRLLSNRLRIQQTLTQHPDILDVPIQRPLIITGLPRTGTTLLQRLLAQDPAFRWLRLWELFEPCPPPERDNYLTDPRIKSAQTLTRRYKTLASEFATVHFVDAQQPEEGNQLFEHAFANILFELRTHIPSYRAWLRAQDMRSQYQYYRQQLQLLSYRWSGRWLLKAPCHLFHLQALFQTFPDACVIQTHRDPSEVVPSTCSLAAIVRSVYTDTLNPIEVGEDWLDILSYSHRQGNQFRHQNPSISICDINYTDLVKDPLATVSHIYNFFGDHLSPEAAEKMQQWLEANPQRKHGTHHYSLDQFGLTEKTLQSSFS